MSQAEIAAGAFTPEGELPSKGWRLRDFELPAQAGPKIRLSDFRGRTNLVMILDDGQTDATQLLADAGVRYSEIRNEDAEVLAITRSHARAAELRIRLKLGYPVLVDEDSLVYRQLGAIENTQQPSAAVYVLDRFGEVFGAYRKTAGEPLPNIPEVLKWLEFINAQCPECEPPEWPI